MTEVEKRIDEIEQAYRPARWADAIGGWLVYVVGALSFAVLMTGAIPAPVMGYLKVAFVVLSTLLVGLLLSSKFFLIPMAESKRRKQLLTDAFDVLLTPETTKKYYNNTYEPSVQRLAANVMENAHFSKEIAASMLVWVRIKTIVYLIAWLIAVLVRQTPLDVVVWITQVVFSADLLAYWLGLEVLRYRHDRVFEFLYSYFQGGQKESDPQKTAIILNAFAEYEATKGLAGTLLSSSAFSRLNPKLSKSWYDLQTKLDMQ